MRIKLKKIALLLFLALPLIACSTYNKVTNTKKLDNYAYTLQKSITFNDEETKTIEFDVPPEENADITISWYSSGEFTNDLNIIEQGILADLMVWKWLVRERDNIADIRRLLRDTDYQLWSEDKTMTSKARLADIAREKASKSMKQYAWSIYNKNMNQIFGLPNYAAIK